MTSRRRKVAVVAEDDREFGAILAEYLTISGFDVRQAADGLQALLHVKRERPSLVLLDLHMPRLGGLETLQRIRALDPTINVVIVTGDADPELHRQAMALGAGRVLLKPLNPLDLGPALGVGGSGKAPALPPEEPPAPPKRPETPQAVHGEIVVVDDDPGVRALLQEFLAGQGHRARAAGDALAALRAIGEEPPDVVLLDIEMPGLNGIDALPAIRAVAPSAKVILVSAAATIEKSKRSLVRGVFDYVVKPIDLASLGQSVEIALAMKREGL